MQKFIEIYERVTFYEVQKLKNECLGERRKTKKVVGLRYKFDKVIWQVDLSWKSINSETDINLIINKLLQFTLISIPFEDEADEDICKGWDCARALKENRVDIFSTLYSLKRIPENYWEEYLNKKMGKTICYWDIKSNIRNYKNLAPELQILFQVRKPRPECLEAIKLLSVGILPQIVFSFSSLNLSCARALEFKSLISELENVIKLELRDRDPFPLVIHICDILFNIKNLKVILNFIDSELIPKYQEEYSQKQKEKYQNYREYYRERYTQSNQRSQSYYTSSNDYSWESILGVSRNCSAQELKSAYRNLSFKYHPDINKSKEAEEKMKKINSAYEMAKQFVSC